MNPRNRFETLEVEPDLDNYDPDEDIAPRTQFLKDHTREIIARNNSPDVGFETSINPYRGCEHGCIYCFARPFHEFLGFSSGLDFETKILVKEDAPELLREQLSSRKWLPEVIAMSGVTDCYQPVERKLRITRRCLEVLTEFRNPVTTITKNYLVTRDVDLYAELASMNATVVNISVTTLDEKLQRVMEPRTSIPARRLAAIEKLSKAGVPVNVLVAPVIPGLTDHEIPVILQATRDAGARSAHYVALRLAYALAPMFENWLEQHFPDRKDKVLNRIRDMRGGKLYDSAWGKRMSGEGFWADQMRNVFDTGFKKAGFPDDIPELSLAHFRRPTEKGGQFTLFG
jgi:DNA repair photolyase